VNRAHAAALLALALLAGCTPAKDSCTSPSIKCGDRCIDGGSDPANCGACGRVCGTGTTCCSGSCVDVLGSDTSNCGGCGQRCPVNGVCTAGSCSCPAALPTQCSTSPGACVNLTTGDGGYCGACGWTCAGEGVAGTDATCTSGACVCAGTPEATDCGNGGAGQCVNTRIDKTNCGGCGQDCPPHATCAGGTCGCGDASFPDSCGTTAGCVNLSTDRANCGSCGHLCTGATPTCKNGLCCGLGQSNCSGVCVSTQSSTSHCGTCGYSCAAGQTCSNGACTCPGTAPVACGSSCCAGSACCPGNTCQTGHLNGLGGSFYDCNASPTLSRDLAVAAANSWNAGIATYDLYCQGSCLARQTNGSCAMWCWQGDFAGHVTSAGTTVCDALCSKFLAGGTATWP
jgi:hypothetical protein